MRHLRAARRAQRGRPCTLKSKAWITHCLGLQQKVEPDFLEFAGLSAPAAGQTGSTTWRRPFEDTNAASPSSTPRETMPFSHDIVG